MAANRGPTGLRLELGLQLRQMRENLGLTRKQAVQGLKISDSTLQRIETGGLNFRNVGDLRKLLEKYGVLDDETIDSLVQLNRDSHSQDWLTRYRSHMPPGMPTFVGVETEARIIRAYHPTVIYGLLQTEAYARALFDVQKPVEETTSEFIARNVELRMARKQILTGDNPVELRVILSEAALRYIVGDPDVVLEQYAELVKLAAQDHITIQVLPFGRGYRATSDFTILDLGEKLPQMVQIDTAWGAVSTSDKPREVGRFSRRFDAMAASALAPEDTPSFLQRLEREL